MNSETLFSMALSLQAL